jgi:hypothetical protein
MFKRSFAVKLWFSVLLIIIINACFNGRDMDRLYASYLQAFETGDFVRLEQIYEQIMVGMDGNSLQWKVDSLKETAERIILEFPLSRAEIQQQLESLSVKFTLGEFEEWEKINWLEYRCINGERRYFKRAATNLRLILEHHKHWENLPSVAYSRDDNLNRLSDIRKILVRSSGKGELTCAVQFRLDYGIDLLPGSVMPCDTVKCWMPWPRENHDRQQFVKLLHSSPEKHLISRPETLHRTVYFENPADSVGTASFNMILEFDAYAQYYDLTKLKVLPYDHSTDLYNDYTSEYPPHIVFTPRMQELSESIAGQTDNPVEIVRKLFYWIDTNIPWTGALEYSLMPFIPGYVIDNMRGDCGMKTLLFMTLARIRGIPVRWQSGWMLHPGEVNLHDWCEVYYEGVGWVPLDMSFGLMPSDNIMEREFYMSGIDAYRLIVNDDIGAPLEPVKRYFRSEPWDFQRGELEWKNGNLYFNKWHYRMEAEMHER